VKKVERELSDQDVAVFNRIIVAIDDSQYAYAVMETAAKLTSLTHSDVVVLTVIRMPALVGSEGEINTTSITEEEKMVQSFHKSLMDKYFSHQQILIESKILYGDPADKICQYAEAIDADLVVIGTHGRGAIRAALLGSVSEKVVRNCKRSVLVVKKR
jgi:nucleotide-binding universal stress UspA family protein